MFAAARRDGWYRNTAELPVFSSFSCDPGHSMAVRIKRMLSIRSSTENLWPGISSRELTAFGFVAVSGEWPWLIGKYLRPR